MLHWGQGLLRPEGLAGATTRSGVHGAQRRFITGSDLQASSGSLRVSAHCAIPTHIVRDTMVETWGFHPQGSLMLNTGIEHRISAIEKKEHRPSESVLWLSHGPVWGRLPGSNAQGSRVGRLVTPCPGIPAYRGQPKKMVGDMTLAIDRRLLGWASIRGDAVLYEIWLDMSNRKKRHGSRLVRYIVHSQVLRDLSTCHCGWRSRGVVWHAWLDQTWLHQTPAAQQCPDSGAATTACGGRGSSLAWPSLPR